MDSRKYTWKTSFRFTYLQYLKPDSGNDAPLLSEKTKMLGRAQVWSKQLRFTATCTISYWKMSHKPRIWWQDILNRHFWITKPSSVNRSLTPAWVSLFLSFPLSHQKKCFPLDIVFICKLLNLSSSLWFYLLLLMQAKLDQRHAEAPLWLFLSNFPL